MPTPSSRPAAGRFSAVPATIYAAAVASGAADPAHTQVPATIQTGELLIHLLGDAAATYPAQWVGLLLNAMNSLRGYLMGEIFGSLRQLIGDADELHRAHLRTVMLGMGFAPGRVEALDAVDGAVRGLASWREDLEAQLVGACGDRDGEVAGQARVTHDGPIDRSRTEQARTGRGRAGRQRRPAWDLVQVSMARRVSVLGASSRRGRCWW